MILHGRLGNVNGTLAQGQKPDATATLPPADTRMIDG
jgi:hypothetical protein